ncbi:MAG: GntR family transcriptional regulator [bacterium]|nr:GntR family transcriptional regulator [bacterium]
MQITLRVRPGDPLPLYQQIVRQIEAAIAGGRLSLGDKLPSHRELALELVVAPLTVKKAYDQLESGGWIETRRGRGTFVAAVRQEGGEVREHLRQRALDLWRESQLTGVSLTELIALIREVRGAAAASDRSKDPAQKQ